MEYCTITKAVSTPDKTVIWVLKKEIENSKQFLEALKKAKDKNPVCKVKPKITAQSKGIAGYKGVFATLAEADASDKLIRILPARDGHVYEIRSTEAGQFIARVENVPELSQVSAGFLPALPPIPVSLFVQILSFFRYYARDGRQSEVMAYILWDKELCEYVVSIPMQKVGKAHISVVIPPDETIDPDRYVYLADIHSHNSMPAFFSKTDDRDELATRVYIVVGRLDSPTPEICARISVGGRFVSISLGDVIDVQCLSFQPCGQKGESDRAPSTFKLTGFPDHTEFPQEWLSMVSAVSDAEPYAATKWDMPTACCANRPMLLDWIIRRLRREV